MTKVKDEFQAQSKPEFDTNTLEISRISRTVAGGRRLRFRATIIVGDRNGTIGIGIAKGNDVNTAIKKATNVARKHRLKIKIKDGTITRPVKRSFGSTKVYIKPARTGSSIIAGGSARSIFELAGIHNISCKIIGSTNKINVAYATIDALQSLSDQ